MTRDEAKTVVVEAARDLMGTWSHTTARDRAVNHLRAMTTAYDALPKPECSTCDDRGRVWDGTNGETKSCPSCAIWWVWVIDPHAGGTERDPKEHWAKFGTGPRGVRRIDAERVADHYKTWRVEVRRYDGPPA